MNSKPSSFKAYFFAARPKTLFAGVAPVLIGLALVLDHQAQLKINLAIYTILCTILMQMGTNYVNDVKDALDGIDDHNRLGPKRATLEGWLTPKEVTLAYQVCFLLALSLGILITLEVGILIFLLGLLSLSCAYCYTGGPYPLSRMGLGEVVSFLFFGPVAVMGTYYIQTHSWDLNALSLSFLPGLGAATLMSLNNMRDREGDLLHKKITLATILSAEQSRFLPLFFVGINLGLCLFMAREGQTALIILTLPWLVWGMLSTRPILKSPITEALNRFLGLTGMAIFVQSLIVVGLALIGVSLQWI